MKCRCETAACASNNLGVKLHRSTELMISLSLRLSFFALFCSLIGFGQTPATQTPGTSTPAAPAAQSPDKAPNNQNQAPDTPAPAAKGKSTPAATEGKQATDSTPSEQRDRAQAYYHYSLAHMYE